MTDDRRRSALAGRRDELAAVAPRSGGAVALREVVVRTQLDLRLRPAAPQLAGIAVPSTPSMTVSGPVRALWLGPDEWLLLDEAGDDGLEGRLRAAGADAVVDVSAARAVLELSGPAARELLAHGCALDLHESAFPTGSCAPTRLALAEVAVLAVDAPASVFWILVRPSLAGWLVDWLLDAATELLTEVPA